MSKFKKIILAILVSCFAVCAGLAIAACTDKKAANFRMPSNYTGEAFNGNYAITVQSQGGMKLNDVRIDVKKGGKTVISGISKNGFINFKLEPDVYQLVVDPNTIPEGFYLDGTQYTTTPYEGNVTVSIPSRVISSTAASSKVYSVGDVMYDFLFTDAVSGARITLSDLLYEKEYKAVMLNFFFVGCSPCRLEFPAIEDAYQNYKSKMAIVAFSNIDSASAIATFAGQMGLNFNMAYDSPALISKFSVSAFPTTVIIDRFGIVATINREGGKNESSYWRALFNRYTSDSYTSNIETNQKPVENPTEWAKPTANLVMPESSAIAAAINGEVKGNASINRYYAEEGRDKEFTWPWLVEDGCISASNALVHYSFATVYAELFMTPGDAISYEYFVTTETEQDILYVLVNGDIVAQHSGTSEGWKESLAVYVANRNETVTLAFMYYKDAGTNVDNERASIKNLNIRPANEVVDLVDQQTLVVNDLNYDKNYTIDLTGGYNVSVSKDNNSGYYYIRKDGKSALLLADVLYGGFWAEKHLGATRFTNPEGNNTQASVYHLSYWEMSNYESAGSTTPLKFSYLSSELSEELIQDYYLQGFSDNGLIPVTDELIEILNRFVDGMYANHKDMFVKGDEKYDGQWLEFCYYFIHYGDRHTPLGENEDPDTPDANCYRNLDPVAGLIYRNAFTAVEGTAEDPVANNVNVTKIINLSDGGGIKFKFVPNSTGVYLFYSKAPAGSGTNPRLRVVDSDYNLLCECDNDMRYNSPIYADSHDNYFAYVWLEAGKTYYVHGALSTAGDTGKYDMFIEYQETQNLQFLRYASTGDGMFTFNEEPYYVYYLAVNVTVVDGTYYHYTNDFRIGSKIYIDFLHQNYFDRNGHTLAWMIENGTFDFRKNGGLDYTTDIKQYYRKSIQGKQPNDQMYGLVEADQKLVSILSIACQLYYEEGASSGAWEMFACYFENIGIN